MTYKSGHAWNHAELFHSWTSRTLSKFAVRKFEWCLCLQLVKFRRNELFCSWEIANRRLFFGGEFTAKFCENFTRKRKLWFSLLRDAYNYKAPAKRSQHCWVQHVVRLAILLQLFGGCWIYNWTSIATHATYVAIYWVHMLWSFGRGLTSMPMCLLATFELRLNKVFCSWESWIGILKDSNFSRPEKVSVWKNVLFTLP